MIDVYASEPHFADHLKPIHDALSDPGDFILSRGLIQTHGNRWHGADRLIDDLRPVLVASVGDQRTMEKAGRTKIARIEHGAGQSYGTHHGSYAGGDGAESVSLFLVPNQYSADKWKARYPHARVEITGTPRLDALPARQGPPSTTVAISFHWDCYLVPETTSAFATFRYQLDTLRAEFPNLIGHGHPRAMIGPPSLEKRYRRADVPLVRDFDDVCRQADVYICDNSSSLFEFAATGRPVVVMNAAHYRRDVHHGLRFWDCADVGVQVDDPARLVEAVHLALADPPEQRAAREAALDIVYPIRSGAAHNAARALEDWAA